MLESTVCACFRHALACTLTRVCFRRLQCTRTLAYGWAAPPTLRLPVACAARRPLPLSRHCISFSLRLLAWLPLSRGFRFRCQNRPPNGACCCSLPDRPTSTCLPNPTLADEHYFPTLLATLGRENETYCDGNGVASANWTIQGPHPHHYT